MEQYLLAQGAVSSPSFYLYVTEERLRCDGGEVSCDFLEVIP